MSVASAKHPVAVLAGVDFSALYPSVGVGLVCLHAVCRGSIPNRSISSRGSRAPRRARRGRDL